MEVTSDGWAVTDQKVFRFLVDNPPPRPYGIWDQICRDARCWQVVAVWAVSVGTLAIAAATGWWLIAIVGVFLFGFWRAGCRMAVRTMREHALAVAVIDDFGPHWLFPSLCTAQVALTNGRRIAVTIETLLVRGIIDAGRRAEILFLDDPHTATGMGIAARAALSDKIGNGEIGK